MRGKTTKRKRERASESKREQKRARERGKKKERERATNRTTERETYRKKEYETESESVCRCNISKISRYQGMRLNSRYQDIKVSDSTLHTATFLKEICHTHLGAVISSSRAREAVVAVSLGLNPQFELCAIVSGCIQ